MIGYLVSKDKSNCFGCEACVQVCGKNAISMREDEEGFRYPVVEATKCVDCGACRNICPVDHMPQGFSENKFAFGGYHTDQTVRDNSTSGGAFSAIVERWCDDNYVIFGAASDGLKVYHTHIQDKRGLNIFRKSKYSQSIMGDSYAEAKKFLSQGKKVLFSGTPCQIAGLRGYLKKANTDNLLTVEVICEGVPSPLYIRKYDEWLQKKYHSSIKELDYRYTDMKPLKNPVSGKWDFEVMHTLLENGKSFKKDRWFNPFWSIWLNHLMSRPSCYRCPFTNTARVADISLGDLWGVHLYCPELYGKNGGASLVVCNTEKGKRAVDGAKNFLYGHELDFEIALKYQSPMRKPIAENQLRDECMRDLREKDFVAVNKKWAKKPSLKLLWQKYVWGNRQKIALWNLKQKFFGKKDKK